MSANHLFEVEKKYISFFVRSLTHPGLACFVGFVGALSLRRHSEQALSRGELLQRSALRALIKEKLNHFRNTNPRPIIYHLKNLHNQAPLSRGDDETSKEGESGVCKQHKELTTQSPLPSPSKPQMSPNKSSASQKHFHHHQNEPSQSFLELP